MPSPGQRPQGLPQKRTVFCSDFSLFNSFFLAFRSRSFLALISGCPLNQMSVKILKFLDRSALVYSVFSFFSFYILILVSFFLFLFTFSDHFFSFFKTFFCSFFLFFSPIDRQIIEELMLCAGVRADRGGCKGDSGGPLVVEEAHTNRWRYSRRFRPGLTSVLNIWPGNKLEDVLRFDQIGS